MNGLVWRDFSSLRLVRNDKKMSKTMNNEHDNWQDFFHESDKTKRLSKQQKISLGVLVAFGLFIFVFWAVDIRRRMTQPFVHGDGKPLAIERESEMAQKSAEEQKKKDTDADGLNDYDETNIYQTSPYLEDSDGDAILDKAEISAGTDPNCPTGKDCSIITRSHATSSEATSLDAGVSDISTGDANVTGGAPIASEAELKKAISGQADAPSLRAMLISSGMAKDALDKISDEELLANYKEVLGNK